MDAQITLKLTPGEFDLIRTAVEIRRNQQYERAQDNSVPSASRASSRKESVQLTDLLDRMR